MAEVDPKRFIECREAAGFSQSELARRAGVGQSSIQRIEAGQTRNPRNLLELARILGCSPHYLLGETDSSEQLPVQDRPEEHANVDEGIVLVDQLDLRYGMGGTYVEGYIDVEKRPFPRDWLRTITKSPPEYLSWASGIGDSMEPTIRSREVILIDRSERTPQLDDEIWAVVHGEIGMIKRLRIIPGGIVELHSDNPHVRPQTAVDGELHIVGRVIAAVRWL